MNNDSGGIHIGHTHKKGEGCKNILLHIRVGTIKHMLANKRGGGLKIVFIPGEQPISNSNYMPPRKTYSFQKKTKTLHD